MLSASSSQIAKSRSAKECKMRCEQATGNRHALTSETEVEAYRTKSAHFLPKACTSFSLIRSSYMRERRQATVRRVLGLVLKIPPRCILGTEAVFSDDSFSSPSTWRGSGRFVTRLADAAAATSSRRSMEPAKARISIVTAVMWNAWIGFWNDHLSCGAIINILEMFN